MSAVTTPAPPSPSREPAEEETPPASRARPAHPLLRLLLPLGVAAVVLVPVAAALWGSGAWPSDLTVDVKTPLDDAYAWVVRNRETNPVFLYFLLHLSNWADDSVSWMTDLLLTVGWFPVTVAAVLFSWRVGGLQSRRGAKLAAVTLGSFALCGVLGMWEATMETLALMAVAVTVSAVIGGLLGLGGGLSDRFQKILRPALDTMQIMPAFAYLLPLVLLFGIGVPSALIATIIYAAPPMARLTALGLRGADAGVMEAAKSLGASPWQRLATARLPLARKEILLGLNQTIMMALSMVTIASVVGAGGLGEEVFQALSTVDVGEALAAGIPIVLLAVWLDRVTAAAGDRLGEGSGPSPLRLLHGWRGWSVTAGAGTVVAVTGALLLIEEWPELWVVDISEPVNRAMGWFTSHLAEGVPVLGGTRTWADGFTTWVLDPLRDGLTATPWWLLVLLAAALGLLAGGWGAMATAGVSMAGLGVIGVWDSSLDTLSQAIAGVVVTLVLGFVVGVAAARVPVVERLLRPVLDTMQTLPQFIYLIPVVALFNVGRSAAVAAAVLYALPAVVRITAQGLRQVDPAALEASRSLGAGTFQQIRQVQVPLARPALMLALNQGVVLVLAMVIVGGFVGSGALGYDVVYGLQKSALGTGLTAGVAIVLLGLVLDRTTQRTREMTGSP
ncbi:MULTISPECIES: ABC transporter permease [unclassified Streptomyces]|uniref:ABC transporter permease n=1 Tax=unclassified Streptomyces TaxID=2593676 RepID=UPI000F71CD79|nr:MULTISPECIES: ABC transporter permease subunit [unclassified Streptomyces]AZM60446.1 glycine/betaine ABC transporter permease [Streptomyces sp. WAC 01438]RSM88438.1 glycine/betaine ABC transporter permease [Streptomyces sp. WAC 01420]